MPSLKSGPRGYRVRHTDAARFPDVYVIALRETEARYVASRHYGQAADYAGFMGTRAAHLDRSGRAMGECWPVDAKMEGQP